MSKYMTRRDEIRERFMRLRDSGPYSFREMAKWSRLTHMQLWGFYKGHRGLRPSFLRKIEAFTERFEKKHGIVPPAIKE